MGFGGAPIGNFLKPIGEAESDAMVQHAWNSGMRYFDTAPYYGHGLSEARLGHSLRWKPRDEYVLSTKVGRVLKASPRQTTDFKPWVDGLPFTCHFDYSYDGTMRSFEDSLQRSVSSASNPVHPRLRLFHPRAGEAESLFQAGHGRLLPGAGQAARTGCGQGHRRRRQRLAGVPDFLKHGDFDCLLVAGRYTLLEQDSLGELLPLCVKRNAAVVIGGGLNSGILATGAVPGAKYNYQPAPEPIMDKVRKIEAVCKVYKVPLAAAALQFLLAHPAIASHVPGTRSVEQMKQNIAWVSHSIPAELWYDLKRQGLLREDAPVPA
jgi:D-threo-aldose 1-dehydrogenase